MIETTVSQLQPQDRFKPAENGATYTVRSNSQHPYDSSLRQVYVEGRDNSLLVTTGGTKVLATRMVREVEVPCVGFTHGEGLVTLLHDVAAGPAPLSVFCGECAADALMGE
jgi:hypothetical protein